MSAVLRRWLLLIMMAACDAPSPRAAPVAVPALDVVRIEMERSFEAVVGDPPRAILVPVTRTSGRVDTIRMTRLVSGDSGVLIGTDSALVPVGVGRTVFSGSVEGHRLHGVATVTFRVADDSVWLAAGEERGWILSPGRYRIEVKTATPAGVTPLIEMAAELKCAPDREAVDVIHCFVRENTPLVIRHTAVRPSTGRALAVVSIHRVP